MDYIENFIKELPEMKSGEELIEELSIFPDYNDSIRQESQTVRLMRLSDLYRLYVPSNMSTEIYAKLYLALLRSLQKKGTQAAVQQKYQNYNRIQNQEYRGILGGSDSFTIIGTSGIGKSSAISRAIELITENRVVEIEEPYVKVIPCVVVQCPFDSSVKGLLLEILRKVDEELGSSYYKNAVRARATTDMLIGSVSQVALNHIGMLIVDEIQNVVNSKNGKSLIGSLTQLINNSGISICMVGTPECNPFFEQAMQLARRSVGLQYQNMAYDAYFESFCKILFEHQYVKNRTEISSAIIEWLYEHSSGILSVVVSLIHDAQEIAILSGKEILDMEMLNQAYNQRLSFLHSYIQPAISQKKQTSRPKKKNPVSKIDSVQEKDNECVSVSDLAVRAKAENLDMVAILREFYIVEEVAV
ncbi:AAA family ATPase [Mediterraneibacter gnavus]|uniref:AAA family ATPase n=1 Tax=Mediterraneibacter gnavus TaxID=33038 RepID=UPI003566D51E